MDFDSKVVLITGAGRGLGRAAALAFATSGAIVAANDITPINLDKTLEMVHGQGGAAREYISDVSMMMPAQILVNQVLEDFGKIDVLINHASVHLQGTLFEIDEWDWRRTQDVNLSGPFFLTQLVGRAMREREGGVILYCLGAIDILDEQVDAKGGAASLASKLGLLGLARAAAQELGEYHIRVHAISNCEPSCGGEGGNDEQICALMLYLCRPEAEGLNGLVFKRGKRFEVRGRGYRKGDQEKQRRKNGRREPGAD